MTVNEVAENAQRLLGYTNNVGFTNDSDLRARIVPQINQTYADLYYALGKTDFKPVVEMDDVIDLPEMVINDCLMYGVCMHIAAAEGDSNAQQYYGAIYNQKRAHCTHFDRVKDVLPIPEY